MRYVTALCILLATAMNALASAPAVFSDPIFPTVKNSACTADNTSVAFAPDHSAFSLLRRNGYMLQTESKFSTTARCRIGLVITRPAGDRAVLRIDVRGADQKFARSTLSIKIKAGPSHHIATYPAGQLLDGGPVVRRFHISSLAAGTSTVWLDVEATARSVGGKDGVQISLDSIDACFVDASETSETSGCATLAPPSGAAGQ